MYFKNYVKDILRRFQLTLVNTKYRWGVDIYADILKILGGRKMMIAFDVGANRGDIALEIKRIFRPNKIHCFEPGNDAFSLLSRRCHGNRYILNQCAVGNTSGVAKLHHFFDNKKNTILSGLSDNNLSNLINISEVDSITLDNYVYLNSVYTIDFLKIDVEGNEHNVLKGAINTLKKGAIGMKYLEYNKILPEENKGSLHTNLSDIIKFLDPLGYRLISNYIQGVHLYEQILTANALFAHEKFFVYKLD